MKTYLRKIASKIIPASLAIYLLFQIPSATAQPTVSGKWHDESGKLLTLWMLRGDMRLPVDSVRTGENGSFSLKLKWNVPVGLYVLDDEQGRMTRIFLTGRDLQLTKNGGLRFTGSPDNQVWLEWMKLKESFVRKQDALEALIEAYPEGEEFRKTAIKELEQLRKNFTNTATNLQKQADAPIAARFIRGDMPAMLPTGLSPEQKVEALRVYMLQLLSFNDTLLIQSDMLPGRVLDYLSLYQRRGMPRHEVEEAFLGAIDKLLRAASAEKKMYFFYLEYLFEGFQRLGFNQITDYLSTLPHFDAASAQVEDLFEVERIIGPYHNILSGRTAPNISGTDLLGRKFDMYQTQAPLTLVVFWSETCPHCLQLIPELKAISNERPEIQIVSIILGPDQASLRALIESSHIGHWIHLTEPGGWESPLVDAYRVYGTPSMYLLDSEKRILARPITAQELHEALNNH
ncbi:MAG: hypothetical protein IPM52_05365 [Bacteroidetes bacterium]|nr:hypothetical protein [Bacteroidota bacterium]